MIKIVLIGIKANIQAFMDFFAAELNTTSYNEQEVLQCLKHFLPTQVPFKDFIHHNTLHAFQDMIFEDALARASKMFGYSLHPSLGEYRGLYSSGRISNDIFDKSIAEGKEISSMNKCREKLLFKPYDLHNYPRIGALRSNWKRQHHIDLDSPIHPILFRILCCYPDQGISLRKFPVCGNGFLASLWKLRSL